MTLPAFMKDNMRLPVIGSPLFIASGRELVFQQCINGIVGSFPAVNARPQSELKPWIEGLKSDLEAYAAENPDKKVAPFAVNQVMAPLNNRLDEDLATIIECEVPIVITSARPPSPEVINKIHTYGGIVFHDVTTTKHARKAIDCGVDGVILVSAGSGGMSGTINPFALYNEVREFYDGIVILAGSMSSGNSVFAAQALGADAAYMGSLFLATKEATCDQDHKDLVVESSASEIIYTNLFTGLHANYLTRSLIRAGIDPQNLPRPEDGDFRKYKSGGDGEVKVWKDIRGAGHGVGLIHSVETVADVIDRLENEYQAAKQALLSNIA